MRALPQVLVLVSSVLIASPALAQRICVVPFTGPGGPPVRNQIIATVCDSADCVAPAKATTANKPDWKKAKRESIAYFVTGAVAKKGKATNLTLQVMLKPGKPKFSKVYPVENGELSAKNLANATAALKDAFGVVDSEGTKTPEVERTPPPKRESEPVATREPERAKPTPEPVKNDDTLRDTPDTEVPLVEKKKERRQYFIAAELGADIASRSYSYVNATTSNLRKYDTFFAMPTARVEFFPLALATNGVLGGLGLEGQISLATWLKSARANTTEAFPTTTMRIDAGLLWRIMPSSSMDLAIYPIVGIRLHSFNVNAAADGTRLDGLPNLNYFGLRAGLGIDVPLANNAVVIFARFTVIPVFASGEVISAAYFKTGSNLGLDGKAGVGIRIVNHLQVRLAFDFTRYGMTFTTTPSDTYIASGAVDQYLGGTASLRFEY